MRWCTLWLVKASSKAGARQPAPTCVERYQGADAVRVHQLRPHRALGHIQVPDLAVRRAAQQLVGASGQETGAQHRGGVALHELVGAGGMVGAGAAACAQAAGCLQMHSAAATN